MLIVDSYHDSKECPLSAAHKPTKTHLGRQESPSMTCFGPTLTTDWQIVCDAVAADTAAERTLGWIRDDSHPDAVTWWACAFPFREICSGPSQWCAACGRMSVSQIQNGGLLVHDAARKESFRNFKHPCAKRVQLRRSKLGKFDGRNHL